MRGCAGKDKETLNGGVDEQLYIKACAAAPAGAIVIAQNTQKLGSYDELFYTPVSVNNMFQVQGMIDSGSMACTLSEQAEQKLLSEKVISEPTPLSQEVVLV